MNDNTIRMEHVICRYCNTTKLSRDSKTGRYYEFGTFRRHVCSAFREGNAIEIVERILRKHEQILNEILMKTNALLDKKDVALE